jgi:hypothetical protein
MGRDIRFYRPAKTEEDEEDYYEKMHIASVSLGSGDAWPCYIRPLFIAAYRRVKYIADGGEFGGAGDVDGLLDTILKCCPPDHSKIDNTRQSCGFYGHEARDFGMFSIQPRHNQIDETQLFRGTIQLLICKAGLWPCVELLLMHARCPFTTPTIRRVAKMMEMLKDWLPFEEEDLDGTPYAGVESDYNLADERWVELREAFTLAASEDEAIGVVE